MPSRIRLLPFAFFLVASLTFIGCGGSGTDEEPEEDTQVDAAPDVTEDAAVDEEEDETEDVQPDDVVECQYPMNDGFVQLGKIMPPLAWTNAYRSDGSTFDFALEDVYCDDAAWGDYNIIMFIVTAEWCPSCEQMLEEFGANGTYERVRDAGGLVVFLEAETTAYVPSTGQDAFETISGFMPEPAGIVVGDGETIPEGQPTPILISPLITGFPGGFVVRRSDMRVISKTTDGNTYIDLEGIAADPDSFWDGPPMSTGPNCDTADEEPSEPANNTPAGAEILEPDTILNGGICDDEPDFYRVDLSGSWLLDLSFDATLTDLDFYLWDEENDTYLTDGAGRRIGSAETGPGEVFQWCGPALIRVFGYNGATAPYQLTLSSLGPGQCQ